MISEDIPVPQAEAFGMTAASIRPLMAGVHRKCTAREALQLN